MSRPRAWLSWSSGKDCAWALHELRRAGELDVVGLLTVVNDTLDRVAMHAVRRALLEEQARAAGLRLHTVELSWPSSNATYEERMRGAVERALADGVSVMAFGDLYLEDIRAYREKQLAGTGLRPVFPLWGKDTRALSREMVAAGLRARLASVDPKQLDASFAGRLYEPALLDELPAGCDPCGENGEFHTFAVAGPMFAREIGVTVGDVTERDGFVYADLVPGS